MLNYSTLHTTAARAALLAGLALLGLQAAPAHAQAPPLTLGIGSASAAPGSSGTFDVTLTNTSTSPVDVGSFSVALQNPATPGVTFTAASADSPDVGGYYYIFGTYQSGPPGLGSVSPFTGEFTVSDTDLDPSGYVALMPNETVSLGDITFAIDPGVAPGTTFTVAADTASGGTAISDASGNPIGLDASGVGTITATPEPSQCAGLALGALGLAGLGWKARKRA